MTGWFCHKTLAISVDFSRFLASMKLYESMALSPKSNVFRSCAVTLTLEPSLVLSMT